MKTISIHKIHLKCDYDNGSILNGTGESVLFAFTLDKAPGFNIFFEPESIHQERRKKLWRNITIYLEDNNGSEVDFNGEILTFTFLLIKI